MAELPARITFAGGSGGFGEPFSGGASTWWDLAGEVIGGVRDWALSRDGNGNGGVQPTAFGHNSGGGGAVVAGGAACAPRPRLMSAVIVSHPCNGNPYVYKNMGPVSSGLFSGDFRAHKRVNKLASKAARGRSRRKRR